MSLCHPDWVSPHLPDSPSSFAHVTLHTPYILRTLLPRAPAVSSTESADTTFTIPKAEILASPGALGGSDGAAARLDEVWGREEDML